MTRKLILEAHEVQWNTPNDSVEGHKSASFGRSFHFDDVTGKSHEYAFGILYYFVINKLIQ